ncbi:MAG: M23 family metallopeptidase [Candidatus Paceibacterota bacterium]
MTKGLLKTSHFWLFATIAIFIAGQAIALGAYSNYSPFQNENNLGLGGPLGSLGAEASSGSSLGTSAVSIHSNGEVIDEGMISKEGSSAVGLSHPSSNTIQTRDGLKKYKVKEGDTLSGIAAEFGISLDTIRLANPDRGSILSPGDELIILPISGILYRIQEGDTPEGVASTYSIDLELIKKYNGDYNKLFNSPESTVILPFAKPLSRSNYIKEHSNSLPYLDDYFQLPAFGYIRSGLHYYNAIDISANCGGEITAAQEGIVIEESSEGFWNGGYGNYIVLEHPNGTKTKYSHNLKNLVLEGRYVMQGELIALIGNNGNSTGCHLHFEVHGAQNPFAKN